MGGRSGSPRTPATATTVDAGRRRRERGRERSSTYRSRRGRRRTAAGSTGWSRCRSGRSPSAASRPTTTAPRSSVVDITSRERGAGRGRARGARRTTAVDFADRGGFETSDDDYAEVVEAIIRDEIGQGEGANLVIGRHYRAVVADWDAAKALTVFRRLLERERGAYWTFCFFTGDRYLIGASPERHVSVHGGDVRMNPISGTFRIARRAGPTGCKSRLLDFLADEKEIYELFMVVDEELKMMCDICHEGGQVLGPFLKPMTHLVHTEYLLAGRTSRDVREVLRDTMYAATVTGQPGRERLPADQASTSPRAAATTAPRSRCSAATPDGAPDRGQPDRDPHRRRRPRRAR